MSHRARASFITLGVLISAGVLSSCTSGSGHGGAAAQASSAVGAQTESNPAGDIPDDQAFVAYSPTSGGFTVTVPEGWARTDTGPSTMFTDKYNSVRIDSLPSAAAPTLASARAAEVPVIKAAAREFALGQIKTLGRKAGQAILINYRADSAPNPVTGKVVLEAVERYEFWRSGRSVVLTLSAPVGSDNVDPWRTITDSFAWTA